MILKPDDHFWYIVFKIIIPLTCLWIRSHRPKRLSVVRLSGTQDETEGTGMRMYALQITEEEMERKRDYAFCDRYRSVRSRKNSCT